MIQDFKPFPLYSHCPGLLCSYDCDIDCDICTDCDSSGNSGTGEPDTSRIVKCVTGHSDDYCDRNAGGHGCILYP